MPAPHRGDTNRPIKKQGKANAVGIQTNKRRAGKKNKERPTPQAYRRTNAAQAKKQGKANTAGKQTNKRRAGNQFKESPTPQAYRQTIAMQAKKTPQNRPPKPPARSAAYNRAFFASTSRPTK
ncbi:hypothetical protein PQR71_41065 [Paraburkholderia fungorum]|uniref:hypothetical protein n=1 Tax=Paraburkholderia fungorum TaxID=134537 RepID=UPI0038B9F143